MKKFFIGCGAFVVLVLVLAIVGIYVFSQWAQGILPEMEEFARNRAELVERYGSLPDYVPPLDGSYDPGLLARFVDVREALQPRQDALAADFDAILGRGPDERPSGIGGFLDEMRSAMDMVARTARYTAFSDSVLMAHEMGRGQYGHIQLVLLYGWSNLADERAEWAAALEAGRSEDEAIEAAAELFDAHARRSREVLREHLANLRREIDARAAGDSARAFLERVEGGSQEFPFTDPVPPALREGFEAHEVRLRTTTPRTLGQWLAEAPALLEEEDFDESRSREVTVEF